LAEGTLISVQVSGKFPDLPANFLTSSMQAQDQTPASVHAQPHAQYNSTDSKDMPEESKQSAPRASAAQLQKLISDLSKDPELPNDPLSVLILDEPTHATQSALPPIISRRNLPQHARQLLNKIALNLPSPNSVVRLRLNQLFYLKLFYKTSDQVQLVKSKLNQNTQLFLNSSTQLNSPST